MGAEDSALGLSEISVGANSELADKCGSVSVSKLAATPASVFAPAPTPVALFLFAPASGVSGTWWP